MKKVITNLVKLRSLKLEVFPIIQDVPHQTKIHIEFCRNHPLIKETTKTNLNLKLVKKFKNKENKTIKKIRLNLIRIHLIWINLIIKKKPKMYIF